MTTGLDVLLGQVDPARMTATVARLAGNDFAGRSRCWTPRIGACVASGKLSSLIGDRR
jgi:hypothetical protein